MPNPVSSAWLCAVPLNPNGQFTIDFASAGARDSYFIGKRIYTTDNMVFIRKDNTIKVGINADVLDSSGVNYVVYTNPEYSGNRRFFAFIKYIEYSAPETSILHIETDSFMTYQFELGVTQNLWRLPAFMTEEFQTIIIFSRMISVSELYSVHLNMMKTI